MHEICLSTPIRDDDGFGPGHRFSTRSAKAFRSCGEDEGVSCVQEIVIFLQGEYRRVLSQAASKDEIGLAIEGKICTTKTRNP